MGKKLKLVSLNVMHTMSISQATSMGWHGAPAGSINPVVKTILRMDVPADKFPHVG